MLSSRRFLAKLAIVLSLVALALSLAHIFSKPKQRAKQPQGQQPFVHIQERFDSRQLEFNILEADARPELRITLTF